MQMFITAFVVASVNGDLISFNRLGDNLYTHTSGHAYHPVQYRLAIVQKLLQTYRQSTREYRWIISKNIYLTKVAQYLSRTSLGSNFKRIDRYKQRMIAS